MKERNDFSGIRLRGHHVIERVERELRNMVRKNPGGGEYDYSQYFRVNAKFYENDERFAQNSFDMDFRLFEEDHLVMLVDSPDDICRLCPYVSYEEGIECTHPYAGSGTGDHSETTRSTKKGDAKAIRGLGFEVGDVARFSEIFRRLVDRSLIYISLGYDVYDGFEDFIRDLDNLFHPRMVELYRKAKAQQALQPQE